VLATLSPEVKMRRLFGSLVLVAALMFTCAPLLIASAPHEMTMGLVQKIFYYHVPAGMVMFLSALVCGSASAIYLWRRDARADWLAVAAGELTVVFGRLCWSRVRCGRASRGVSGGSGTHA